MSLTPIAPISPIVTPDAASGVSPIGGSSPAAGVNFADYIDKAIATENHANDLAVQLATGELTNVHEFTTAAATAQLTVEMTAAVRNRAVEAFNEIMRMQV